MDDPLPSNCRMKDTSSTYIKCLLISDKTNVPNVYYNERFAMFECTTVLKKRKP